MSCNDKTLKTIYENKNHKLDYDYDINEYILCIGKSNEGCQKYIFLKPEMVRSLKEFFNNIKVEL